MTWKLVGISPTAALTPERAAIVLGLSTTTLAIWRSRRTGPAYEKTGKRVVYRPAALEAWMNERINDRQPVAA